MSRDVQDAARSLGQPFVAFNTGTDNDIDSAFANLARQKVKAFLNCGSPFQNSRRERFAMQAARYAVPGIYTNRDFATAGGLTAADWAEIVDTDELPRTAAATTRRMRRMNV